MTDLGLGSPLKFYGDEITLRFSQKHHAYYEELADGSLEKRSGVTNIIQIIDKSPALIAWACKMMEQKLLRTMPKIEDFTGVYTESVLWTEFEKVVAEAKKAHKELLSDAADVGAMAHSWLEKSIKYAIENTGGIVKELHHEVPGDERAVKCGEAALKWMIEHSVEWIAAERVVYSKLYGYAGTMDGLARVDGALSIVDWKSSNALRTEYALQTAAYLHAYSEEHLVPIPNRWILRLGKEDGEFEPWHLTDPSFDVDFRTFKLCLFLKRNHDTIEERLKEDKKARKDVKKSKH